LLEKEFREFHARQSLPRARWSVLISLLVVLAFAAIETFTGTIAMGSEVSLVRLLVLCPMLAGVSLVLSVPAVRHAYNLVGGASLARIGVIGIYLGLMAVLHGASCALVPIVIVVLLACVFFRVLFHVGVALSAFLVATHVLVGLTVRLPLNELLYMTAMLAGAAVIGSIWTYKLEHALRTNFLETRLLNELAERDGLTGLYNRRIFDDFVQRLWRQSRRDDVPVAFVFIDIDYFKIFNDLYGHQ